jgi:preprotein translocase subunit SecD
MAAMRTAMAAYLRKVALSGLVLIVCAAVSGLLWAWLRTQTGVYLYRVPPAELDEEVEVLNRRLELLRSGLRLGRSRVAAAPPDRVQISLRYRDDPRAALAWLTMPGRVEFRLLHPDEDVLADPGAEPPDGYETAIYREKRYILERLGELETHERRFAVGSEPVLAIERLADAELVTVGKKKAVVLTFTFEPEDASRFAEVTALHAGRRMAMLVDGELYFPPREIEAAVTSGQVQVQGYFYTPPLRRLVAVLRTGPLPAALERVD